MFVYECKKNAYSEGDSKWRDDGRCGYSSRVRAECDPDGENPCCNDMKAVRKCGNTTEFCSCKKCTDFRRIYKEWRESGGTKKWRYDGRCGLTYPLPDGTPSQCDPDGEKPCCSTANRGICGNTTEHCSNCYSCINYRQLYKEWRESGGTKKWRYDGRCGLTYPLPDGTPSQCDPDGEKPCCKSYHHIYTGFARCSKGIYDCECQDCIDFRLVRKIRESGGNCTISKLGSGFLMYACFDEVTSRMSYKCTHSNEQFTYSGEYSGQKEVSKVCQNDPYAYQACGVGNEITNNDVLCGGYFCEQKDQKRYEHAYIECAGDHCKTENRDCDASSDKAAYTRCNDECETFQCEDESNCNGYRYGVSCKSRYRSWLKILHVSYICTSKQNTHCDNELDKQNCTVTNSTVYTCPHFRSGDTVPILNYTRCSVLYFNHDGYYPYPPYCRNFHDQTNCSDIERVGGHCKVNGHMSSVSKYMVCQAMGDDLLCDDNIQNNCLYLNTNCRIHKHRMWDGYHDCKYGSDENQDICKTMSDYIDFRCARRFNPQIGDVKIPVSWIMDNETDCMNGEDEDWTRSDFSFCPGEFKQILHPSKSCQNVYKCPNNRKSLILLDQLCDGAESCGDGSENRVCRIARDFPTIDRVAPYIIAGAARNICHDVSCEMKEWIPNEVFGVEKNTFLVPFRQVSCRDLFGEHYLFLSCMNLCSEENVRCPLDKSSMLQYNSCPGQFESLNRALTLADNSYLTFVEERDKGTFHQLEYFQCKNSRCVEYRKVCDLVDDCGDMSDEINCRNHMICEDTLDSTKHQFISLSQKCDGIYDCFDLSDECNNECGREILGNWVIKITGWFMGILALVFNFFTVINGVMGLKGCETEQMMTSMVLMSLVGFGDFLIGLYLVTLSVYDSFIFGKEFCRHQAEWLTGTACLVLGVISTLGSQLSLFTMTVLSIIRMYGLTCKPMRVPGPISKKAILRVASIGMIIITAALAIAITPLVPALDDLFVQGMYYDKSYRVFIGFPNKEKHVKILQEYYEYDSSEYATNISTKMSWTEIGEKVDGMFSQDNGNLTRSPVHFYGNDGVCLFKYFVRADDARRSRLSLDGLSDGDTAGIQGDPVVWTMLAVNFLCFVIISCCYIVITVQTRRSSQRSGQRDNPERLKEERAIQNKIILIIATDFLCWVPLIIISALHIINHIDATDWYVTFVMIVLPLNSIINPIVYDKTLVQLVVRTIRKLKYISRLATTSLISVIAEMFSARMSLLRENYEIEIETIVDELRIGNEDERIQTVNNVDADDNTDAINDKTCTNKGEIEL